MVRHNVCVHHVERKCYTWRNNYKILRNKRVRLFWKKYFFDFIAFMHSRFADIVDSKSIFFIEKMKIPLTHTIQRTQTCCITSVIVNRCVMWKHSSKILWNKKIICDWKKNKILDFRDFLHFVLPLFADPTQHVLLNIWKKHIQTLPPQKTCIAIELWVHTHV